MIRSYHMPTVACIVASGHPVVVMMLPNDIDVMLDPH